ncbi:MAG: aminotransferase class V-fold PLP-dependent enzyme [Sediminibacterium sp.]|nr:aminotransferase class V-fold PLP-dependent enzyme [Sediminibacterium sp.]
MKSTKRQFLKNTMGLGLGVIISRLAKGMPFKTLPFNTELNMLDEEAYWNEIRKDYLLNPDYINLENGYYCMQPQPVLEDFIKKIREVNYQAAYYMRNKEAKDRIFIRQRLAELLGCKENELGLTRNTTESYDIIINGLDWKAGDEVIYAEPDYGSMISMLKQQARRFGIVTKAVSIPLHPQSDEEIVGLYEAQITPKTKLISLSHIINISGQILPVKKIVDLAHSKNIEVIVDGAHSFAQLDFKIADLGCDYYACSLHKWLSVPLGEGLLYIHESKIPKIWPNFAPFEYTANDIRSINHIGTHAVHSDLAILTAIDYYLKIGPQRKENRLRFLQQYWTNQVRQVKNISVNTPIESARACGIANVGINNLKPKDLAQILFEKYKVYTVAIDSFNVHGVRVTPQVYTTLKELDIFVSALKDLAANI